MRGEPLWSVYSFVLHRSQGDGVRSEVLCPTTARLSGVAVYKRGARMVTRQQNSLSWGRQRAAGLLDHVSIPWCIHDLTTFV